MLTIEEIRVKLSDRNLAEVARRIGVTRAYLSAICNGKSAGYETIKKLSDYLGGNNGN